MKKTSSKQSLTPQSGTRASTMEELLQKTGSQPRGLVRGQVVEGTVLEITGKSLILDIGAKSEGLVVDREYNWAKDFIRGLSPGDKVAARVISPEAEGGQVLLSVKDASQDAAWKSLEGAHKKGEEVSVQVVSSARSGLNVEVAGLQGFIPGSHLGTNLAKNPQGSVGKSLKVKPIEIERRENRLVFSEKAVSEADVLEAQEKALGKVKKGAKYKGRVVGITGFGAFVQIEAGGVAIDGLVHLSELSWEKVENPQDVVGEGQEVEVVVIGKGSGPGEGRLALSIKQAGEDPWKAVGKKYKPDQKVRGKITKVGDYGALAQLEPGVEGLLHLSKIPAGVALREGEEVDLFVEEVNERARRIGLGMVLKEKPIGYK